MSNRRDFITQATLALGALSVPEGLHAFTNADSPKKRWRGFNLTEKFDGSRPEPFSAFDFQFMADHGFNFARLPLSYRCWSGPKDYHKVNEKQLKEIDTAVHLGQKYDIHVNINFHRIPGYCINPPEEPLNLWKDEKALDAACYHWMLFAKRYKGIPSSALSFDLINEPSRGEEIEYVSVVKTLIAAIRSIDPHRLIIADGWDVGRTPVFGLASTGIMQSTRGYDPMMISHYKADWWGYNGEWPTDLKWPWHDWDKEKLYQERILPWAALEKKGVRIHVGEWGCYNQTPHAIALAWMEDQLKLWKKAGWGWSLWNLRGFFGVINSARKDVKYVTYQGKKLDKKMLDLLKKY